MTLCGLSAFFCHSGRLVSSLRVDESERWNDRLVLDSRASGSVVWDGFEGMGVTVHGTRTDGTFQTKLDVTSGFNEDDNGTS